MMAILFELQFNVPDNNMKWHPDLAARFVGLSPNLINGTLFTLQAALDC